MPSVYQCNRTWADQYLPRQLNILRDLFPGHPITVANADMDLAGTDAMVGPYRVSLRIRRYNPARPILRDITIRLAKGQNGQNELSKLRQPTGANYMLYCIANDIDTDIAAWVLVDLSAVRRAVDHWWADVPVTHLHGDHSRALAVDLRALDTHYGPAVMAAGGYLPAVIAGQPAVVHAAFHP